MRAVLALLVPVLNSAVAGAVANCYTPAMGDFNFIDATARGYRFVWAERRLLASLAVLPLAVKMGCFAVIILLGYENNLLRQGLLQLPGFFMEGWLVALCVRLAVFGERPLAGAQGLAVEGPLKALILSSAVLYTLTRLVSSFFDALSYDMALIINDMKKSGVAMTVTPGQFFLVMLGTAFVAWAFRFFWLYVPLAMNVDLRVFFGRIKSFLVSFLLIGMWLLCAVPATVALGSVSAFVQSTLPPGAEIESSMAALCIVFAFKGLAETIVALIAASAMAFAVRGIMTSR